jgi:DNA-binding NarL/FixJ family response regulator
MNTRVGLSILDLSMLEMDGLEVLWAARYMPKPKILVVTGLPSAFGNRMLEAAGKLGATATLDKQHAVDRLVPIVGDLLADRQHLADISSERLDIRLPSFRSLRREPKPYPTIRGRTLAIWAMCPPFSQR